MLPKRWIFLLLLLISSHALANKISFGVGLYSIDAEVDSKKTSLSNLGAYKFQYHTSVETNFEFTIGYSILIENIFTGDKAFGPSLGFSYFPFGSESTTQSSNGAISLLEIKNYNPYIFTSFNQRQYQSVKATYSGFAIGVGSEVGFSKTMSFYGDLQYGSLEGPNKGSSSEVITTIGIIYNY